MNDILIDIEATIERVQEGSISNESLMEDLQTISDVIMDVYGELDSEDTLESIEDLISEIDNESVSDNQIILVLEDLLEDPVFDV